MGDHEEFVDEPIEELKEHLVEPGADLEGRVRRSINRNVLTGDTLELAYTGLVRTAWNYLELALSFFDTRKEPGENPAKTEEDEGTPQDEEPGS